MVVYYYVDIMLLLMDCMIVYTNFHCCHCIGCLDTQKGLYYNVWPNKAILYLSQCH